ncbi:lactonase family protein [Acinetobacter rathckeae]|uniref:lactonase family protein n=1 Tax=Acinetobacter rathckeae TaxID=2605272 RepID=UPI0018A29948|nr:lactonase family protein [Acinetobacter rathckeae]MBF7687112.1 lactonase family protein [Acinetobacter rathckeae]MBF7694536.1 lactonase family protein [Acinetobacter rathckeae]
MKPLSKLFIALSLSVPLLTGTTSFAENNSMVQQGQKFLVGTWTGLPEGSKVSSHIASEGLYTVQLNQDGSLLPISELKVPHPSWITFSKDHRFAYVTNEMEKGRVTALAVDANGELKKLNDVSSLGDHPTHSTLSPDGKYLLVANYSVEPKNSGVVVLPILANGELGEAVQNIPYLEGSNVVAGRQKSGHAHSVTFSPDGKTVYAADLGADVVKAYDYQPTKKEPLKANKAKDLVFPKGSGPRHLVFSDNGKFAYVTSEMSAEVTVFADKNNKLVEVQRVALSETGHESHKSASGLAFSPDQQFLYVGNRKEINEIVAYKVDQSTGQLALVGRYSSSGLEPRAFSIDPSGNYLIVSNVNSHTVSEFKRNKTTGALKSTRIALQIGQPTDIKFIP